MGFNLAKIIETQLHKETLAEIDAVIPIPETANVVARSVAQHLGKELVDGFLKNRYVFRTFIMPTQKLRRTGVRRKLNAITTEFRGKNVLLVDDSIVRGTTSKGNHTDGMRSRREEGLFRFLRTAYHPSSYLRH